MKVHYLEIVTSDPIPLCRAYEAAHKVRFNEPDALLGGAKVCQLADGSYVGVRAPLRDNEMPVVRPYWLVDNIGHALVQVEAQGAFIAIGPLEIPSKGRFAIYLLGGTEQGLWQL